jgi:diaminohydroxyphosphoribosylaminopyrimidine deaminase/5-amino-6-(5-phosphoribosylamino)uracil reductase
MVGDISAVSDETSFDAHVWPSLLEMAGGKITTPHFPGGHLSPWWELYAPIASGADEPAFVVGQLGQSLDGRIATVSGNSHYINGPEAIRHVHRLRALVDAVIVGVGTVIADDPRLTVRHGIGRKSAAPGPARIVIDPNGRLPLDARVLAADGVPVYAVQDAPHPRPPSVTPITLPVRDGGLDPNEIVAAVAALGFRRILVEGGAATVSAFLAAGAIDRLHLCVAPLVIGSGKIGITLPPIDCLEQALRPPVSVYRMGCDMLFDCDVSRWSGVGEVENSALELAEG